MKIPTFIGLYEATCVDCASKRYMIKQSRDPDDLPASFGDVRLVAHVKGNYKTARAIAARFQTQPGVAFDAELSAILEVMRQVDVTVEIVQRMQAEDSPTLQQQQDAERGLSIARAIAASVAAGTFDRGTWGAYLRDADVVAHLDAMDAVIPE